MSGGVRVAPIPGASFGAVVTGVDIGRVDDGAWQRIEEAFLEHAVLVFPAQHGLTRAAEEAFARRFGGLEFTAMPISNQRGDRSLLTPKSFQYHNIHRNALWHTDSTYKPLSSKAGMLFAVTVPSEGGQTQFADMRAAYRALDERTKGRIATLSAYHSIIYSTARAFPDLQTLQKFFPAPGADYEGRFGEVFHGNAYLRPLVKIHPVTGRPSLFVASHAFRIPGMEPAESDRLLDELLSFACRPPRIYEHAWRPGDLVVWDNRCVLHRARPYDTREARVMRGTRVAGDPRSETSLPAPGHRGVLAAEIDRLRADFRPAFAPRPAL